MGRANFLYSLSWTVKSCQIANIECQKPFSAFFLNRGVFLTGKSILKLSLTKLDGAKTLFCWSLKGDTFATCRISCTSLQLLSSARVSRTKPLFYGLTEQIMPGHYFCYLKLKYEVQSLIDVIFLVDKNFMSTRKSHIEMTLKIFQTFLIELIIVNADLI